MTGLTKNVQRRTSATVFEKSQRRHIIATLIAPAKVGVRLAGTRDTYKLDVEALYAVAVKMHVDRIERKAKWLIKHEGLKPRSARARARKELASELR